MKTRRIDLNPNEVVEVINAYGTPVLKVVTMFNNEVACVVIYEQPGTTIEYPSSIGIKHLTPEPSKEEDLSPETQA